MRHIHNWKKLGYYINLIFLSLPSAEIAIARVAERVKQGGHNISSDVIRRRFMLGKKNFEVHYREIVDSWGYYDNSGGEPALIEWGEKS